MDGDFQDKVDDYVLNRMSEKSRKDFEIEVCQDKEKEEQVKLIQDICSVIKSRNEKLALMVEFQKETINPKKYKFNKSLIWLLSATGIAAVLLIGFILFVPEYDMTPKDLILSSGNEEIVPFVFTFDTQRDGKWMASLSDLIREKQYEEALSKVTILEDSLNREYMNLLVQRTELNSKKGTNSSIRIKEGVSYEFELDKEKITDIHFHKDELELIKSLEHQKILLQWMKANTLIALGRFGEAVDILNTIRNQDFPYKLQADSIYNVINKVIGVNK